MVHRRNAFRFLTVASVLGASWVAGCDSSGPALPTAESPDSSLPEAASPTPTADGGADQQATLPADAATYLETTLILELALTVPAVATDGGSSARPMDLLLPDGALSADDAPDDEASPDGEALSEADAEPDDASEDAAVLDAGFASDAGPSLEDATLVPDATGTEDAAANSVPVVEAGSGGDAAPSGDSGAAAAATLTITARDGVTPVVTDLWLYTLGGDGQATPLSGFSSTASRKSPRLMLPATIGGQPSGLSPADDGRQNGVMTNTSRGTLDQGAFVSAINGTVVVTLPSIPQSALLVVAGIEDQRYAGAAVINPDGSPGVVPSGFGQPETHTRLSFERDVAPILKTNCSACHNSTGPDNAGFYLVTGSRDDLVNDNFALKEQTLKCQTSHPDGGAPFAACVQAITQAQYLVEPGAPAATDLLQRARPDEDAGTSALGLAWYGSRGARYTTTYGDRRMPSTTVSTNSSDWTNQPTYFDLSPAQYQTLFDWVAQGAPP